MTDAINAAIALGLLLFAAWAIRRSLRAVIRADRVVQQILRDEQGDPDTQPGTDLQRLAACRAIDNATHTAQARKEPQP